MRITLHPVVL